MNNQQPVPCRCGRIPERNTHLKGYEYSFVCKCGGSEINFASWSDNPQKLFDNWESLIKRTSTSNTSSIYQILMTCRRRLILVHIMTIARYVDMFALWAVTVRVVGERVD